MPLFTLNYQYRSSTTIHRYFNHFMCNFRTLNDKFCLLKLSYRHLNFRRNFHVIFVAAPYSRPSILNLLFFRPFTRTSSTSAIREQRKRSIFSQWAKVESNKIINTRYDHSTGALAICNRRRRNMWWAAEIITYCAVCLNKRRTKVIHFISS